MKPKRRLYAKSLEQGNEQDRPVGTCVKPRIGTTRDHEDADLSRITARFNTGRLGYSGSLLFSATGLLSELRVVT